MAISRRAGPSEEAEPPPSAKEEEVAKEAWTKWNELVKGDQEAWKIEAEAHHLPKVEMVDWVYVEAVATKSTADVLTAVGRMYAAARSEGFDVRRIHTYRGREYYNAAMRTWCARHGLHKTFVLPEEHQSNGRAEGAIMRVKSRTRVLLQEAGCEPGEWPLAAKLAPHAMRNHARRILHMKLEPSLPYIIPRFRYSSVPGIGVFGNQ